MAIANIQNALRTVGTAVTKAARACCCCFPCCCVRQSSERMETGNSPVVQPPSNSWIKCSCLRNGLKLTLSRKELSTAGEFSEMKRNGLINDDRKLCAFLQRGVNTINRSENEIKKNDLRDWARSFRDTHRVNLNLTTRATRLLENRACPEFCVTV